MPWVVGVDEAGYGPNLGPLAQVAVSLRLPDVDPAGWDTLRPHVRRAGEKDDGRVLIDDSKLVHQGVHGLARLERGVLGCFGGHPRTLAELLAELALAACAEDVCAEHWCESAGLVPLHPDPVPDLRPALAGSGVAVGPTAVNLVVPWVFNRVVAGSGNKSTVLTTGLVQLLRALSGRLAGDDPVLVLCDKQGGRNFYAPLLTEAFDGGRVVAECESADESRYRVEGLDRTVTVVFRPRADAGSASVALASMAAKYLREVCMRQFNAFWAKHVPGLKPTAGYPGDARRFYGAIRDAMARLGVAEECVWRCR